MQNDVLEPCPFCGGEARLVGTSSSTVQCQNDQCIIGDPAPFNDFSHRYDAIAAWNTRTPAQPDRATSGAGEALLRAAELQDAVADALNAAYDVVEGAADDDPANIDPSDIAALGEALERVSNALPVFSGVGRAAAALATAPKQMDPQEVEAEILCARLLAWQPEQDDRVKPLLLAEASRRDATDWSCGDAENLIAFLLAALTTAQPDREAMRESVARVERVETVPLLHPFDDTETPPIWRVVVGGHCADFDHEQAACNFCAAINNAILAKLTPTAGDGALREAMNSIARTKYGLQGIYEDYRDTNARNYHEMIYWRKLAQSYEDAARVSLGAGGGA